MNIHCVCLHYRVLLICMSTVLYVGGCAPCCLLRNASKHSANTVDLHGLHVDEALQVLAEKIHECSGMWCVCVCLYQVCHCRQL